MPCLGNDVVDLGDVHNRRSAANPRFAARVLTRTERQAAGMLASQSAPGHVPTDKQERWLWVCWSAKEAAYKALSRHRPGLAFIHRHFQVSIDPTSAAQLRSSSGTASGTVRYRDVRLPVNWQWTTQWIHSLLGSPASTYQVSSVAEVADAFGVAAGSVHGMSPESSAVRTLAARLLEQADIHDVRIERRPTATGRPGAPCIVRNGAAVPGWTVSLSHDGRFVAAAVSAPGAGSGC